MRRDGDRLLKHLASAKRDALICAPFIKAGVLTKLLLAIPADISVRVVTRWHAKEVAAGVSDLETFDIVSRRARTSLFLLDRLHAKIYLADGAGLVGSANLTGAALGWSDTPNVEFLSFVDGESEDLHFCLAQLEAARPASADERDRILEESQRFPSLELADDATTTAPARLWLPRLGAPSRLYQAYAPELRDRLSTSVLSAASSDLTALGIPPGLDEVSFRSATEAAFQAMPTIKQLLDAADEDLDDLHAIELIGEMQVSEDLSAEQQWLIVREWMTSFLGDRYEIAPASFVVRRKSGRHV